MNENYFTSALTPQTNLQKAVLEDILHIIFDVGNDSNTVSKIKYEKQMKLIEDANDMCTQEKLNAIDKISKRRNQECWQIVITGTLVSLTLSVLLFEVPIIVKTTQNLIAA